MPTYLVERELLGADLESVAAFRRAANAACRRFEAEGKRIRYLRSTFTPGRSRCSCLFEAPNAELVRELNEAAQLPYSRIVTALDLPNSELQVLDPTTRDIATYVNDEGETS